MAEEFHSTYGNAYGYAGRINDIRDKEFPNLQDIVYLDHTGCTLYAKSQLQSYHEDLLKNTYGNPHSSCLSSELSSQMIEDIRQDILYFFNTTSETYQVIFTSNASNALKLVAENFTFNTEASEGNSAGCGSWFVYLQDNHTSVVGIRANASSKGARIRPITHEESLRTKLNLECGDYISPEVDHGDEFAKFNNLFAFPAMSNFSGRKYPLGWIDFVQNNSPFSKKWSHGKWFVILDAASFVSTSRLDLATYQPDFIPISFYKLFGFPTGLGALLVSVRGSDALKKTYFGGGTVSAYSSDTNFHVFRPALQDRYKDGTPPFLEILSLRYGFEMLAKLTVTPNKLTMDLVGQHTFCLAHFVYHKLKGLRHYNGQEACRLYSDTGHKTSSDQGPIINFNILRSNGDYVGYSEVSSLAAIYNIHLRTGCFCNVGACQHFLKLTSAQLESNLKAGHVCGDEIDLIDGRPTGSVRISFGYMSDLSDAKRFISFIEEGFIEKLCAASSRSETELTAISKNTPVLRRMFIYPIKSCAAFEVYQWDINERGFCYDREWVIVNQSGAYLSQKRESRLCLIKPSIDLKSNVLRIEAPGMLPFLIPLDVPSTDVNTIMQPRICGSRISGIDCGDEVSEWLTLFLGKKCRLLRQNPNVTRKSMLSKGAIKEGYPEHAISLANESQLLIISETSCTDLLRHVETSISGQETHELTLKTLIERFRPNLVVNGMSPYEEESWYSVEIGNNRFQCCGVCHRCQVICIDQTNGKRSKEPLRTLAKIKGSQIPFGVHLLHVSSNGKSPLAVGDIVQSTNSP